MVANPINMDLMLMYCKDKIHLIKPCSKDEDTSHDFYPVGFDDEYPV
jgi:hypothetical protein